MHSSSCTQCTLLTCLAVKAWSVVCVDLLWWTNFDLIFETECGLNKLSSCLSCFSFDAEFG